jgi:16S rRNA (uracil1498-N3)-methyltransferase
MRRFYASIESFKDGDVMLDADETRHLRDVLRLEVDDEVSVFEGSGREFRCSVLEIGKKSSSLKVVAEIQPASPESAFEITLAATVVNGEKYDLVIQKAVELGVTTLVPLHTVRCDVKVNDAVKRMSRWRRIALEATKQSGRAKIMQINEPVAFDALIGESESEDLILFSERDGEDFSAIKPAKKITALFGPKGGWDDSELEAARSSGIKVVTLGGRILRAETAAISITAILQHRFGDLN